MRIRRLHRGDGRWIVRADSLFDDRTDRAAAAGYLGDPSNVFFLALDGSEPVGFLRGTSLRQLKTRRRQMFLYEIAVAPSHHRQGVGRALVRELLRFCRQRRYEEAFVFTDPGNVPAVGLYRSTGAVTETAADRMFVYQLDKSPPRTRAKRPARRRLVGSTNR